MVNKAIAANRRRMMGYPFTIHKSYRVKSDKDYPWPCGADPNRTLRIFADDVLTLSDDGTFMKHTGLGTFGHVIPMEDVVLHEEITHLQML
jgi:hypothetical protein